MDKLLYPVPISFHVFNRPETTRITFDEIRKIRPCKLFITADGPRESNESDKENCLKVRKIIAEVDWECDVYTNFSDLNKGSFKSAVEGITWVFEHVDRAVILQDDDIPHCSFFRFCKELLDYYENDYRVALISGNNFQLKENSSKDSYYFSRYTHIWGWATWRRTWEQIDFSMKEWPEYKRLNGLKSAFSRREQVDWWDKLYQEMYDKKRRPHWDYLLSLSSYMNNTLTIIPSVNLVSNVGFGEDSSNCKVKTDFHCIPSKEMQFPLKHPKYMARFVKADDYTEKTIFSGTYNKWLRLIKPLIPKIILILYRNFKIWKLK